jgi:hypothetical protein
MENKETKVVVEPMKKDKLIRWALVALLIVALVVVIWFVMKRPVKEMNEVFATTLVDPLKGAGEAIKMLNGGFF